MPFEKNVCVVGLGYIGLPTASLLATKGYRVLGVDVDRAKVRAIRQGTTPIVEPGLDVLVRSAVQSGRLETDEEPGPADVFVIAVPTPLSSERRPDLSFVEAATESIAPHLASGNLVILESTSPVGTTREVGRRLQALRPDLSIPPSKDHATSEETEQVYIAHCPERVLPGRILQELVENDRLVGGVDEPSTTAAVRFYESFVGGTVVRTDACTAEMAKLAENAYRDVNIAFANELSMLCKEAGVDPWELIALANRHPRVDILRPGPGVGGHCIPIDPWFLIESSSEGAPLLRTARGVNERKTRAVIANVLEVAEHLSDPVIACLGLTYKSDVDDLRESPALEIASALASKSTVPLLAVEPNLRQLPASLRELGAEKVDLRTALERADLVVFLVPHEEFSRYSWGAAEHPPLLDFCGGAALNERPQSVT